jgi:hypothetical protein
VIELASVVAHNGHTLFIPIEVRPHVGAALAAGLADKPWLDVGEPEIVGPNDPP